MLTRLKFKSIGVLSVYATVLLSAISAEAKPALRYDFGSGDTAEGYIAVSADTVYTAERGYGFEPGGTIQAIDRDRGDALKSDFVTSDEPFFYSVKLPEGNYRVTMTLGDAKGASNTTVKAELRRLMLEKVQTAPRQFQTQTIIVNIRTPDIPGGGKVRLKAREKANEMVAWDDKLTLEFNGMRPCLCAIEIEAADNVPTVYLLGDSTVCDQPNGPWNSWGQMLTRFFKPEVAVANHAQSGESIRSSLGAKRFDKVWSLIQPGDYLFLQFGHNDMKRRTDDALETYHKNLLDIVAEAKKHGVTPVLVTSMERKAGIEKDTLEGYPDAVRDVAAKTDTALIDLHAMSKVLYKALGDDLDKAFQDGTHHNNYGSYELAKCIIQGIIDNKLELSHCVVDDFGHFDPAKPDPVETFNIPASPMAISEKPLGN